MGRRTRRRGLFVFGRRDKDTNRRDTKGQGNNETSLNKGTDLKKDVSMKGQKSKDNNKH